MSAAEPPQGANSAPSGGSAAAQPQAWGDHASETVKAWQCIGCGKIEAPQTCIGVCQDRKVEFVYAADHTQALARLAEAVRQRDHLAALLRRLAHTTPRNGEWERAFRRFQEEAREHLAMPRAHAAGSGAVSHDG